MLKNIQLEGVILLNFPCFFEVSSLYGVKELLLQNIWRVEVWFTINTSFLSWLKVHQLLRSLASHARWNRLYNESFTSHWEDPRDWTKKRRSEGLDGWRVSGRGLTWSWSNRPVWKRCGNVSKDRWFLVIEVGCERSPYRRLSDVYL